MHNSQISITKRGEVKLHLDDKQYKGTRSIGWLSSDGSTFNTERDRRRHVFRKLDALAFSHDLMTRYKFTWVVVYCENGERLVTSRKHILERGTILNFQKNQLERQIFLPLSEFGIEKARETENKVALKTIVEMQGRLFS